MQREPRLSVGFQAGNAVRDLDSRCDVGPLVDAGAPTTFSRNVDKIIMNFHATRARGREVRIVRAEIRQRLNDG